MTDQTTTGGLPADLETLQAERAIREQLSIYCRAFDRLDDELALSVWHEDGTVQYGAGDVQSIAQYLGPSTEVRRALANCSHQVANLLVRVRGTRAVSEAYVTASLQDAAQGGRQVENLFRGRYVDRWSLRGGRWAIDHRQFVPDSHTRIEFDAPMAGTPFLGVAKRDRSDPSYLAFAWLDEANHDDEPRRTQR